MLLIAIAGAWVAALAFPLAIKLGFTESAATRLPWYGLSAGAALGLLICMVESVKHFLVSVSLIFIMASVFWFFAVVAEGFLVGFGLSEDIAEWLSPAAFCFGLLLGGFALSVDVYDKWSKFLRQRRKRQALQ